MMSDFPPTRKAPARRAEVQRLSIAFGVRPHIAAFKARTCPRTSNLVLQHFVHFRGIRVIRSCKRKNWYRFAEDRGNVPNHECTRINTETRYSLAVCMGARKAVASGNPDHNHVSTSYVERQNLTMRMSMRRFTRLTNGHSKKLENHEHAVAIHYMYYNFGCIHQLLRVTPAMEAGISDHVWSIEEVIALLRK